MIIYKEFQNKCDGMVKDKIKEYLDKSRQQAKLMIGYWKPAFHHPQFLTVSAIFIFNETK